MGGAVSIWVAQVVIIGVGSKAAQEETLSRVARIVEKPPAYGNQRKVLVTPSTLREGVIYCNKENLGV